MTYTYFLICSQQSEEDSLHRGTKTYGHRCVRPTLYYLHRKNKYTTKVIKIRAALLEFTTQICFKYICMCVVEDLRFYGTCDNLRLQIFFA